MDTEFGCGNVKGRRVLFAKGTGEHARIDPEGEPGTPVEEALAQIVHDLKNPLSTIALEVELMDARPHCCHVLDISQSVGRIRRNVSFLDRLIHDLLDACTLSNGKFALRRVPCDLGMLLATVIDRVVPSSERHRVQLDAAEGITVAIDELRIERVIENLLDNALKYTPKGGGVAVRLMNDGHRAHVSVSDTGPGLTPAEVELVFEPYKRATTARGPRGNGLGLYVSKQIVEAHGGHIGVESVRGLGARFHFALPLRD